MPPCAGLGVTAQTATLAKSASRTTMTMRRLRVKPRQTRRTMPGPPLATVQGVSGFLQVSSRFGGSKGCRESVRSVHAPYTPVEVPVKIGQPQYSVARRIAAIVLTVLATPIVLIYVLMIATSPEGVAHIVSNMIG